jgi:hypothetical protein
MNARPSSSSTPGLPGVLAALAGSAPRLQPAVATTALDDCAPCDDMQETLEDANSSDDWTAELMKRLSVNLRSFSIIGFGRCRANEAEEY